MAVAGPGPLSRPEDAPDRPFPTHLHLSPVSGEELSRRVIGEAHDPQLRGLRGERTKQEEGSVKLLREQVSVQHRLT